MVCSGDCSSHVGPSALAAHRVVKRVAHVGRDQHLVAGADPERGERQLEGDGAGGDGGGVLDAQARGELALERGHFRPLRELARAHDARDALGVVVRDGRFGVRNQRLSSSRMLWKASAYFTRAWIPRKLAVETASSRIDRSSMLVLATCERCASRHASFLSSTFSMSVKQFGVKLTLVGPS